MITDEEIEKAADEFVHNNGEMPTGYTFEAGARWGLDRYRWKKPEEEMPEENLGWIVYITQETLGPELHVEYYGGNREGLVNVIAWMPIVLPEWVK